VNEVERNIRYAERQAQRAERYKDQFERLKKLETQKAFYEISQIEQELSVLKNQLEEQTESLSGLEASLSEETQSMRRLEDGLRKLEETFLERESARSEVLQQLTSLENHREFHREKIESLKLSSEKMLGEVESLEKSLEILRNEIETKNQGLGPSNEDAPASGIDLTEQQSLLFGLATQISSTRNLINEKSVELASLERAQISLRETRAKLTGNEASIKSRFGTERTSHGTDLNNSRTALTETIRKQEHAELAIKNLQKELEQFKTQITKLESQLGLFQELDQASGPDPKTIIADHASQQSPIKALLDLVQIEPGYELAAEAVLQDAIKGVVTEDEHAAFRLLDRLKKDAHKATIFIKGRAVLNGSLKRDSAIEAHPLVQKRLWDVVRVQKDYEGIFGNLFGNVYVVEEPTQDNIGQLVTLAERSKLVSRSGALLGSGFQLSLRNGGYTPEKSVLARNEEKNNLDHEIRNLLTKKGFSEGSLQELELELENVKKQRAVLQDQVTNQQAALERMEGSSAAFNERLLGIREELELLEKEERQNAVQLEKLASDKQRLSETLISLEREEACAETLIDHLQKEQESKKALELLFRQKTERETRIQIINQERREAYQQINRLETELADFQKKESEVRQLLLDRSVETEQLKQERAKMIEARNQILEQIQLTSKAVDEAKQKTHRHDLKEMEWNHQKRSVTERLQSRYKISLTSLNFEDHKVSEEEFHEMQPEIERLSEKIDAIGTVNLLAIEEYDELKTRYDFLLNQKRDLVESRDALLEAIRKINRTTKKLFEETLVRVRENFHQYFRNLFGGGQADLILLDEENPTESGLEIVARPPGKKLQHITLLSGGEKAMTAIALLLALFSVRPSPFCVLDEVDAPLDEANNERFILALKPFLVSTQFIIVTHSRKTIAMGDALYGVTMQEPGVSKLVSVKLTHDQQGIEHADQKLATELNQVLT
jgi:chromosome segregation protein